MAQVLRDITRRHLFSQCRVGLGGIALAHLMGAGASAQAPATANPLAPKKPHYRPTAKNVIYLFMAGGPSQLELFDYKPKLVELNGQPIPDSYIQGKRFAFMDSSFKNRSTLMGTRRKFARHGKCGAWVSELFPHTAGIVDQITLLHSVST